MDVKSAFLHGDLDEEIYMEQPIGFIVAGQEHKVCKLQKALYSPSANYVCLKKPW
jgi:hypothetical protein